VPRRRHLDALLLAAVGALAVAVAVDAVTAHRRARPARVAEAQPAPASLAAAPPLVALRGSPETAFLPDCRRGAISLSVEPRGQQLFLQRSGGRCHLPALHFEATVHDALGNLLYRGPAVARGAFSGANLAGPAKLSARLLPGVLRCDVQAPLQIVIRGGGLSAAGAIRCRGSL
jgi:hypothetical protein